MMYLNRIRRSDVPAAQTGDREIENLGPNVRSDLYQAKAREMKSLGEKAKDPTARTQFVGLCMGYELLAERLKRLS